MNYPSGKFLFLVIIAMITWGFSWSSGKYIAGAAPPEVLLFWRFLMTFTSLVPVVYFSKKGFLIERRSIIFVLLGGIILTFYNYLFFEGLKNGLAGAGGVLVTTLNPVITFVLSSLLHRHKPVMREKAGILLGMAGGMVMIHVWTFSPDEIFQGGNLYFLLAASVWALLSINGQYSGKSLSPLHFSLYVYGISTLINLVLSAGQDMFMVFSLPMHFWLNLFYLSVVSTTFGTTVYFFAASRYGSKIASSFIFIVPVSAVIGSIIFLGERPGPVILAGGLLALTAVYLINSGHDNREKY